MTVHGGGANVYARNYLRSDPNLDYANVRHVRANPDKAHRCTRTVATVSGHECRVNVITHEVFDRHGASLRYVCCSSDDDAQDIERWLAWLSAMRSIL